MGGQIVALIWPRPNNFMHKHTYLFNVRVVDFMHQIIVIDDVRRMPYIQRYMVRNVFPIQAIIVFGYQGFRGLITFVILDNFFMFIFVSRRVNFYSQQISCG